MSGPIRNVAVVGRDAPAWLAAAALRRTLGRAGVDVHVVELPPLLQAPDVYGTVPSIRGLHRMLGLEEEIVVRACDAVPMVGQRFSNWSEAAPPFVHAYENDVPPGSDLSFIQYWLKGRGEGLKVDLSHFGVGTAAALQARVPIAAEGDDPALSAGFGYHLDARAYSDLLKRYALHHGVTTTPASAVDVEADGERICSVTTDAGARVEAQLFVDATGPEAMVIGKLPGAGFESWRRWFRADRMMVASAPPLRDLPAFSQISAVHAGWVGLFPLRSRTAVSAVYDSSLTTDEEIAESLPVIARMPIGGDAVVSPLDPGVRARPWVGNCVAIGEAAIATEPLDAVQVHLAHASVSHLISLFPADAGQMPEANAYNRVVRRVAENVRDFQLAHYKLNRRFDDPFWNAARDCEPPETLERKLRLFALRGFVPLYDDESFFDWNWAELFIGHGLVPGGYDPRIDAVSDQEHVMKVQARLHGVADVVRGLPSVGDMLSSLAPARTEGPNA